MIEGRTKEETICPTSRKASRARGTPTGTLVFLFGASHAGGREPSYRDRQRCGVLGR